jgi:predicted RNA-binding Zn ribbon-like protein
MNMVISQSELNFIGGALCLDFVNTVDWRLTQHPNELLKQYSDLVDWSKHAGIASPQEAGKLLALASRAKRRSHEELRYALKLREILYRIFGNHSNGSRDLEELNAAIEGLSNHRRIVANQNGFRWKWKAFGESMDSVLWPVIQSAAELLLSPKLKYVRECAGTGCGWLFLDLSRSHSRRWCNMSSCGNRFKVLRHYYRAKRTADSKKRKHS